MALTVDAPASVEAHQWDVAQVPQQRRLLGGFDHAVLWGSLGIGLLVMVAGGLLANLGLARGLLATAIGAVIGSALLGAAAIAGSDVGLPTMVLYRGAFGARGSYAPTIANIAQLVGWATIELYIIGVAAGYVSQRLFGFQGRALWIVVFGVITTALTLTGPVTIVRRFLERFGIWAVLGVGVYLTWYAATRFEFAPTAAPAPGAFWQGVDLAIAMPVSWIPLVADYSRFGRSARATAVGTAAGFTVAQVWFFGLGIAFVFGAGGDLLEQVVAVPLGALALLALLVVETDEAFANIYSTGVSVQNLAPRLPGRPLALVVGALATLLAALIPGLLAYEAFLFIIGALFIPAFGIFAADYFVLARRHYDPDDLLAGRGRAAGVRWSYLVIWLLGFLLYNWINPGFVVGWVETLGAGFDRVGVPFPLNARYPWLGASLPALAFAFFAALAVGWRSRRRA